MRTFPDIRKFAWKSTKETAWQTTIATAGSGRCRTLTNRKYPKWTIVTKFQTLTDDEKNIMFGFINQIKGAYEPFFFLDPEDNKETNIPLPSLGTNQYQCVMKMGDFVQPVYKVTDLHVFVDGVELPKTKYIESGGVIQLRVAQIGKITASYTYYWKVIMKNDGFKITAIFKNINQSDNLTLETVE